MISCCMLTWFTLYMYACRRQKTSMLSFKKDSETLTSCKLKEIATFNKADLFQIAQQISLQRNILRSLCRHIIFIKLERF